jgi:hypothetical protein
MAENSPFVGMDPKRQVGVAQRYRKKMPSLKSLKGDPCGDLWINLMNCYATHDFNQRPCAELMFDFRQCAKEVVRLSPSLPRLPPSLPPFLLPLFFLFPPHRVLWHIYSVFVASNPMGHFLVMVWLVRTSGRG